MLKKIENKINRLVKHKSIYKTYATINSPPPWIRTLIAGNAANEIKNIKNNEIAGIFISLKTFW